MFLIHKVASRRPSRDHITGRRNEASDAANTLNMEYNYTAYVPPEYRRGLEKRRSRSKSGLFGSARLSSEDEAMGRTDSRATIAEHEKDNIISFGKKKKLRKAASKASFSPVTEEEYIEKPPKSPMLRRTAESWKARSRASSSASVTTSAREGRISQPFNFFHISHANQRDFPELNQNTCNLPSDWVRVSTLPPGKGSPTPPLTSPTLPAKKHYSLRSKFLSRHQPQSPSVSIGFNSTPSVSEESFRQYTSISPPPPRSSSRQALDDFGLEDVQEQFVCHAITTPDESAYGQKSPGIERILRDLSETSSQQSPSITEYTDRPHTPPIPGIRETQATPENDEPSPPRRTVKRISICMRPRPLSQFSELNAEFIMPGSPLLGPNSSRASRRFSYMKQLPSACLGDIALEESWEEDIDYSYEHAAESYCDFEWERSSNYAPSTYAADEEDTFSSPTSAQSPFLLVPEKKKEYAERRITGQFEAHLLLPGSSGSDIEPQIDTLDDESGIILRAAHNSLCHRSIESIRSVRSSASASKLASGKTCRDELARVAEHLEDHIAFLNAQLNMKSSRDSLRPPSQLGLGISTGSLKRRPLNRARTDSDATCVTLCSDAETITPTDSAEIITPPNSNHNSFTFGHSHYDEARLAKGLSFPASTIPGVIEFSPEISDLPVLEGEPVPFI